MERLDVIYGHDLSRKELCLCYTSSPLYDLDCSRIITPFFTGASRRYIKDHAYTVDRCTPLH
jgi:hypothetical protein